MMESYLKINSVTTRSLCSVRITESHPQQQQQQPTAQLPAESQQQHVVISHGTFSLQAANHRTQ